MGDKIPTKKASKFYKQLISFRKNFEADFSYTRRGACRLAVTEERLRRPAP
jgi:hypothetical protein